MEWFKSQDILYAKREHEMPGRLLPRVSEVGNEIRTVQELLGHKDVTTTMIYTHVLNRGGLGVRSPADDLDVAASTGFPDSTAGGNVDVG